MLILAYRPAPIIVSYLVYPGTSALPHIDYFIVDKRTVPPEGDADAAGLHQAITERAVYLPDTYQVNTYRHYAKPPLGDRWTMAR